MLIREGGATVGCCGSGFKEGRKAESTMKEQDARARIVSAVAVAVVIPMLVVVYFVVRLGTGKLGGPGAVVVLFLLALVLVGVGADMLRRVAVDEPEADAEGGEEPSADGEA